MNHPDFQNQILPKNPKFRKKTQKTKKNSMTFSVIGIFYRDLSIFKILLAMTFQFFRDSSHHDLSIFNDFFGHDLCIW
jgi:ribosomal protein S19